MSLWNKPVANLTYEDVAEFCQQRFKESLRLEYKGEELPRDFGASICAKANEWGGLIVLGVSADKTTNEPIWPAAGLKDTRNILDRIVQIGMDAIYPPVRVHHSRLLTAPGGDRPVVAVRVDPSPELHATDKGTKIYVYERGEGVNKPWVPTLAHIDRIAQLMDRRRPYEQKRERLIDEAIARAKRFLRHMRDHEALRWGSMVPLYPWQRLCEPELCYGLSFFSGQSHRTAQRMPDGAFARQTDARGAVRRVESLTADGHIFALEVADESTRLSDRIAAPGEVLDWIATLRFINDFTGTAREFYKHDHVEMPGLLQLDFGFLNVEGKRMRDSAAAVNARLGEPFPNGVYRSTATVNAEPFIRVDEPEVQRLFQDIQFGFDLLDPRPLSRL